MTDKEELIKMLEDLKKTLDKVTKTDKEGIKIDVAKMIEETRAKNKEGIKDRFKESVEFACTDGLDSYIIVTNEKQCISASRFDAVNLLMDFLQYLVDQKVLNKKAIRKIVDCAFMDNDKFKENSQELFNDIMNTLVEDMDNLMED